MNITKTEITTLPLKHLRPNTGQIEGVPANPRQIDKKEYAKLKKSLQADNLTGVMPLKVYLHNGEYVVLGGNMRLRALKEIGAKDVECIVVPADTDADTLRKIVITDNSTFGEWDNDMLANEWDVDELQSWGVDVPKFGADLSHILDEANFESLNEIARGETNLQQITFLFQKEDAEIVKEYTSKNGKEYLVSKIVELCQKQDLK